MATPTHAPHHTPSALRSAPHTPPVPHAARAQPQRCTPPPPCPHGAPGEPTRGCASSPTLTASPVSHPFLQLEPPRVLQTPFPELASRGSWGQVDGTSPHSSRKCILPESQGIHVLSETWDAFAASNCCPSEPQMLPLKLGGGP